MGGYEGLPMLAFWFRNTIGAIAFVALKDLIVFFLYIGAVCIIYGTYVSPAGSEAVQTPPEAAAGSCTRGPVVASL